jgi:hypothetical protein
VFDLLGMNLVGYVLRVCRDIVSRNPRFQRALGDVGIVSGNRLLYGDVQIIMGDVNTEAQRISFDNFISTMTGRAILTKVRDKDSQFIEYIVETDATAQTPIPGIYYINIDSVDEGTRRVEMTMETYKWYEGRISNALGTKIGLAPGINGHDLTVTDPTQPGVTIDTQASATGITLLSTVNAINIVGGNSTTLTPNADYWIIGQQTVVIVNPTVFGTQTANIPTDFLTVSLTDQDGFVLRNGKDYTFLTATQVQLSSFTASGQVISAVGMVKLDPTVAANLVGPENTLPFTLSSGETLAPGQVFVRTQGGSLTVTPNAEGQIIISPPLAPGGFADYSIRVLVGRSHVHAYKNAINNMILPGLRMAFGDKVVVGDQAAIIVSPFVTETYRVSGGKPPISFTLECKANDPATADEIAKDLFAQLLVTRKGNLESDGLSLLEAGQSLTGGPRDDSGTAGKYSTTLSFSGLADWRLFQPLVTRVTNFEVQVNTQTAGFGPLSMKGRFSALTATGFIPDYR